MAKLKTKKRNLSENVHHKKVAATKKQLNPFEIHINKEKMAVLGRKAKNDRGLPGVARAKAIKKRKDTLLKEYQQQNKSNKFTDRRIGERNGFLTEEDKLVARFAAIRKKGHKRSIFNLNDDEVLTHKGQTLAEVEKFDDPRSDDEENYDEDRSGKLDNDFVKDAHFGGGILTKTGKEGAKTHRELIDQLISESKKRKAEQQKIKEATLELTEKLDSEWKDLLPLVSKKQKGDDDKVQEVPFKSKVDDYDKVMHQLKFEARGTVSDRLKTEDELAQEEKERLEDLERQRVERMKGLTEQDNKQSHRSADDLDEDFVYESDNEYQLSYNQEGESNLQVEADFDGKKINGNAESGDDEAGEEEEEEEDLETESEDDLSDLKADESDEENVTLAEPTPNVESVKEERNLEIRQDLEMRKELMDKARSELSYTYTLPTTYDELQTVLANQSSVHQSVIVERMIKCNHPSLGEKNKENLGTLFAFLLQHLNDVAQDATSKATIDRCFDIFHMLSPKLFELAALNPENGHNNLRDVIQEKHDDFKKRLGKNKNFGPPLDVLLFFKLIGQLFTTSDFRHQVVTPCFIFMEQILNKCRVNTRRDVACGLFVATLVMEYTIQSKRYLPSVINFLGGILHMAVPKTGVKLIKVRPPFKPTSTDLVLLTTQDTNPNDDFRMVPEDLLSTKNVTEIDELFKVRAVFTTLKLIGDFDDNLAHLPSNIEIFSDISVYLDLLPISSYPRVVQEEYHKLVTQFAKRRDERRIDFIVMEAKRPKALRLYEPKIEEIFDGKKRRVQSKEKADRDKLIYKLRKEKKGALREIRRDKAFLGRVKLNQRIQSDKDRREKVKRIYSEAAMQQSELKSMDRQNKKK